MIFARSNRSIRVLAIFAAGIALLLLGGVVALLLVGRPWDALVVGLMAAVAGAAFARMMVRLKRGPIGRLALFHDRLVLVTGRLELQAAWNEIQTATLADNSEWGTWPELRLTERLRVRLRSGRSFSFPPRSFGLDPAACRDVFLTLRDDPAARGRLPVFDSALDLAVRPLQVGELLHPRL